MNCFCLWFRVLCGSNFGVAKCGIQKTDSTVANGSWLIYVVGSAVFASLTSILGKMEISGVESNLGMAIRTSVVLVMAWFMVFAMGKQHTLHEISKGELGFICLSGIATGASWLCYYKALQNGLAGIAAGTLVMLIP